MHQTPKRIRMRDYEFLEKRFLKKQQYIGTFKLKLPCLFSLAHFQKGLNKRSIEYIKIQIIYQISMRNFAEATEVHSILQ
jgi:hypothetical protein